MKRALLIAVAAMAFSGMPAFANGGGGSGSATPSSSGPSYDPVEEYQSGIEALRAGEFKKAERAFKRVTKVAKRDGNTRYMLGLAHLGQDEFKAAGAEVTLNVLGPGAVFGEIGLLMAVPRTATVRSTSLCDLFILTKADFSRILQDHQQFADTIIAVAKERYDIVIDRNDLLEG